MKVRFVFPALIFSLVAFLFVPASYSQSNTGRILGTVHDQSGGGIADATITTLDVDRGIARTTVSDASGDYLVPNLTPGNYHVRAEAKGFKISERDKVLLEVGKDVNLEFVLVPGSITDVVTVTEEAPLLDTSSSTLGGTISNQTINDLPLNGRDFQNLVTLRPGVQRYPGGGFLSISSNGNRPEDNNFIVDGTDNNDPYYGTTVINAEGVQGTPATHMPIDAIQEFNAEENPPAEYGWKPGAVVNVGLKSGTNVYHGTVYDFERNNFFDARNWFNTKANGPQKALRLHEFGANIGAPIIKNKLFYFAAYEGVRDVVGNSEILPTPATSSLGGDTTNSIPDAITAVRAAGLMPSDLSLSLLKYFPTNSGAMGANLQVGFPNKNREDDGVVKMDYHFNEHQTLSGHYFIGDSLQTERDIPVLQPIWQSQAKTRAQVGGFSWVNSISDRLTNEARFGYNRFWQSILTADAGVNPTTYGLNTGVTSPVNFGFPEIAISGFTSLGGNHGWPLLTTPNQTYQWADIVSYSRGKHGWKFGGELRHGSTDNVRDRYGKGRFRFKGGAAFANSTPLEDFIAGAPTVGRLFQGNSERHVGLSSIGLFVQDDWRPTPRLTINAGLRYDVSTVIKERNDLLGNFDPKLGILQVGSQISDPYRGDHNNFGPRLGIVWDPFGHSKTVVRAGASIIYEIPHISTFIGQNGVDNASTSGLNVIPTGTAGSSVPGGKIVASSNDFTNLNWSTAGPIFPATPPACTPGSPCAILAVDRNIRTPYVVSWTLNIQHSFTPNSSFTAAYVGTKGIKLYSVYDINQVDPQSPAENQPSCLHCEQNGRPFYNQYPNLSFINYLSNGYESKYHGLQLTFNQRLTHGLSFIAGYTWAHAIDQASLNRAIQPQNSLNPRAEWASSDIDIRQRFTLALTYAVPGIKSWGQLLEGWQLNSIVTLQTGLPWGPIDGFFATGGSDISQTAEFADRWNFTGNPKDFTFSTSGGLPYVAPSNFTVDSSGNVNGVIGNAAPGAATCVADAGSQAAANSLLNLGCYAVRNSVLTPPAAGHFGTMGRNLFRGPGYRNWDLSVVKVWTFRERFALQLRGEFFNVLNHPNFTNPYGVGGQLGNVDPSVPGIFGYSSATPDVAAANPVIGSGGPRAIQIGLKFKY